MKKIKDIIINVLMVFIIVFLAYSMLGSSGGATNTILGFSPMVVETGSMEPEIPTGSFIIAKSTPAEELKIGDDITFKVSPEVTYTHRIIEKDYDNELKDTVYKTKGVNNPEPDKDPVYHSNVVGKVILTIPELGYAMFYFKDNKIIAAILIVLVIALFQFLGKSSDSAEGVIVELEDETYEKFKKWKELDDEAEKILNDTDSPYMTLVIEDREKAELIKSILGTDDVKKLENPSKETLSRVESNQELYKDIDRDEEM